jgi:hypothetical protein
MVWTSRPDRVAITFIEHHDGQPYDLESVGAGLTRSVAASLRLAARELRHTTREVLDEAGAVITEPGPVKDALRTHRRTADRSRIRLTPKTGRLPALYLVDEPEAHLHPRAVRSVRDWLQRLGRQANGVLVATHERGFLQLPPGEATVVIARREHSDTKLLPVKEGLVEGLDGISDEMGWSRADLLQLTRLVLFVEGPHDVAVLEAMFGDELGTAGIRLIPIHGAHNALALVDWELAAALGLQRRLLLDNHQRRGRAPWTTDHR